VEEISKQERVQSTPCLLCTACSEMSKERDRSSMGFVIEKEANSKHLKIST
jgi:hypothetical protein